VRSSCRSRLSGEPSWRQRRQPPESSASRTFAKRTKSRGTCVIGARNPPAGSDSARIAVPGCSAAGSTSGCTVAIGARLGPSAFCASTAPGTSTTACTWQLRDALRNLVKTAAIGRSAKGNDQGRRAPGRSCATVRSQ
jgi:hypothetical protein